MCACVPVCLCVCVCVQNMRVLQARDGGAESGDGRGSPESSWQRIASLPSSGGTSLSESSLTSLAPTTFGLTPLCEGAGPPMLFLSGGTSLLFLAAARLRCTSSARATRGPTNGTSSSLSKPSQHMILVRQPKTKWQMEAGSPSSKEQGQSMEVST